MSRGQGGRVAVISGAASGIGQAYAARLAEDGADIVIADIADAADTIAKVEAAGRRALAIQCDLTREEEVHGLAERVESAFGRCDILVNVTGIYGFSSITDLSFAEWRRFMSVNVDTAFLLVKAFVPGMKARGWGRIVNTSSHSFHLMVPNMVHYVTTKGAIVGFTRSLASELGDFGITVNAIAPGVTRTAKIVSSFYDQAGHEDEAGLSAFLSSISSTQAIKRTLLPEDLVGTVSFLTSDDAALLTGQTIIVDGGLARS